MREKRRWSYVPSLGYVNIFTQTATGTCRGFLGVHCWSLLRLRPNTNQRCCRHISLMSFPSAPVAGIAVYFKTCGYKVTHTHTTRWHIKRHTPAYANTCTVNKVELFGRLYKCAQGPRQNKSFFLFLLVNNRVKVEEERERNQGLSETHTLCRCWLIHFIIKKGGRKKGKKKVHSG